MSSMTKKTILIFDDEIIGSKKPVFMVGTYNRKTQKKEAFWFHKRGHMAKLKKMLLDPQYTWVGFNSENFDRPLTAMAVSGEYDVHQIKFVANAIIEDRMKSWQTYREFELEFLEYDHIDLFDVAPGVMISLKTYAGRMGYKTMMDMPMHHDHDPSPAECKIIETYCLNDLGVTNELFDNLLTEIELREEMGAEYGLDLRSKSDAQVAEAVLKSMVGIKKGDNSPPRYVTYKAPDFVQTKDEQINFLIERLESHDFKTHGVTGSIEPPEFLKEHLKIGKRTYQCGIGGLHSVTDNTMYLKANDTLMLSDFDVASYYPNIMIKAGLFPRLGGDKGKRFIEAYKHIYEQRIAAKRAGNKKVANSLKITLNGTFGKLGSIFCSFYSPDLLLAVTLTGQLNLLCLIAELDKIPGVDVRSANTDGILVAYKPAARDKVLKVFERNAKRTGFEYEETKYRKYAAKDVNNYIAIKDNDEAKHKGIYALNDSKLNPLFLMKHPTMDVCSRMAVDYLVNDVKPEESIKWYTDIKDYVEIRNVSGGGVQHKEMKLVDDWFEVNPGEWSREAWKESARATVKRKSRPPAVEVDIGGTPFGRVARWYMTTEKLHPITYVKSGHVVPTTDGGRICMTLPDKLPKDLNYKWYIDETYRILSDLGVITA